ncbi:hypothetical protein J1N35_018698 [Gossypium stocksii]|uniref:Uncharacterized protein n=1 Tax=Gossypium stocksii TaxID=47602 RepID=A0A9D3VPL0_9ROSI|nr:hypothetical protein J1N35_018696 [Gossypium stocksii]KAH1091441.1 hypothetical protein J1N35_018698 [Gossypium stocksii]
MNFEGERDHKESSASSERVTVQELEVNASLPTLGSDNPDLGTEALTWVVREVLEVVFEERIKEISEMLQVWLAKM